MISCVILTRNRADHLRMCLKAICQSTTLAHEIIVVDNGSTDKTIEVINSFSDCIEHFIQSDNSLGVCARNLGFEVAKGKIIAQIDDDVVVHPYWDTTCVNNIHGDVGAVGVQGAYVNPDWSGFGFCWAFKNEGWLYDESFAPFWHEESELQIRMTIEKGYKKKRIPMICSHNCQRKDPVDWDLCGRNLNTIKTRYQHVYKLEKGHL